MSSIFANLDVVCGTSCLIPLITRRAAGILDGKDYRIATRAGTGRERQWRRSRKAERRPETILKINSQILKYRLKSRSPEINFMRLSRSC
jgi:hypothetical protein